MAPAQKPGHVLLYEGGKRGEEGGKRRGEEGEEEKEEKREEEGRGGKFENCKYSYTN